MALQIRRGTNAERILITPLPGELIYVTDYLTAPPGTNAVYVGDGSTVGGIPVAAIPALAGNLVGNINLNNFQINGTGSIAITGGISNTGDLTVTGNILGNGNISRTGNISLVGDAAVTGSITASVIEGDFLGSVFADDSSGPLVNAIDSSFNGNQLTINGTLSRTTTLVDKNILFNSSDPDDFFEIGRSDSNLGLKCFINKPVTLQVAISDPDTDYVAAAAQLVRVARGSNSDNPENIQPNDILSGSITSAYSNDTFNNVAGFFQLIAEDQTGAPSAVAPASWVWGTGEIARDVIAGGADPFARGSLVFDSQGVLTTPVLKVESYDLSTPGDFPILTPAAGMIIFDTNTNEFKGFNGSTWVVLG